MSETIFNTKVYASVARKAQAEGVVMLENRNNALPLEAETRIALFGRSQFQYYKSGTGSGGMVNTAYVTGIREAILEREAYELAPSPEKAYEEWLPDHPFDQGCGWGTEPWFQEEMTLTEELVRAAAQEAEAAIVIIGRTAGEDQDNKPEGGSYYLTEQEETMLSRVCAAFSRTIVLLNVGNIIDSCFYGLIFSESTFEVAQMFPEEGGYAPFLFGKVVDMFYFPIIDTTLPEWVPIWGGQHFTFFNAIFNFADAAITIGIFMLIIDQLFASKKEKKEKEKVEKTVSETAEPAA